MPSRMQTNYFVLPPVSTSNYFERLTRIPLFYSSMTVPVFITLTRFVIHRLSGSSAQRPLLLRQIIDSFSYTISAHSESKFLSGSDRILMYCIAVYAFYVDLIFSGMLFEGKLSVFEPFNYNFQKSLPTDTGLNETYAGAALIKPYLVFKRRYGYPIAFHEIVYCRLESQIPNDVTSISLLFFLKRSKCQRSRKLTCLIQNLFDLGDSVLQSVGLREKSYRPKFSLQFIADTIVELHEFGLMKSSDLTVEDFLMTYIDASEFIYPVVFDYLLDYFVLFFVGCILGLISLIFERIYS